MILPALPLFHRLAGQPVIVLGHGAAAEAKRRLVQRAGARIVQDLAEGIDQGARIAFIAHDDAAACEADAVRARCAGLLANVVDRPELCDFTTPSLVDRTPVIVAVGTAGASAGLAKALRLRLDQLLPQGLGQLAEALHGARAALRKRWPDAAERRRALDAALEPGGALDPLAEHDVDAISGWIDGDTPNPVGRYVFTLASPDPEDLTLRQARLLGRADALILQGDIPPAILARARADALWLGLGDAEPKDGLIIKLQFSPGS